MLISHAHKTLGLILVDEKKKYFQMYGLSLYPSSKAKMKTIKHPEISPNVH